VIAALGIVTLVAQAALASQGTPSAPPAAPPAAPAPPAGGGALPNLGAFLLRSSAFAHTERIPDRHTVEGEDLSPPLEWSPAPPGTESYAIICEDLDTQRPFVHWVIYGIPASVTKLPEGLPRERTLTEPVVAKQGTSSFVKDNLGYRGPATPRGNKPHRYQFTIYALKAGPDIQPGLVASALRSRIKDQIVAEATLIGTYSRARKPGQTPPGVQEKETLPPPKPPAAPPTAPSAPPAPSAP